MDLFKKRSDPIKGEIFIPFAKPENGISNWGMNLFPKIKSEN